jgi:hypothetical protein
MPSDKVATRLGRGVAPCTLPRLKHIEWGEEADPNGRSSSRYSCALWASIMTTSTMMLFPRLHGAYLAWHAAALVRT